MRSAYNWTVLGAKKGIRAKAGSPTNNGAALLKEGEARGG